MARLLGEITQTGALGELPAFAPERLPASAKMLVDITFRPMILQTLFGEKPELLRAEIEPHVARSVALFLTACRHGGTQA